MTGHWQLLTHRSFLADDDPPPVQRRSIRRAVVIGASGSGKTTLARRLAAAVAVPHIELDAIHWSTGNWVELPLAEFRRQVALAVAADAWVVDGNYSKVRDIVWSRADTIIWLDYPLPLSLWRLFWRTLRRAWRREVLWGGNQERFIEQFASRDSLFLYTVHAHRRRSRQYPALLERQVRSGKQVVRLRAPGAADRWLRGLHDKC